MMELLQQRRSSEIYRLDAGRLLKLYSGWVTPDQVAYEFNITKAVFEAGIPCAAPIELYRDGYRHGIILVFEEGRTLTDELMSRPWRYRPLLKKMGTYLSLIHQLQIEGLRTHRDQFDERIEFSHSLLKPYWNKIQEYRTWLEGGVERTCHGDFCMDNILITNDRMHIIDWANATVGDPVADLAAAWFPIYTPVHLSPMPTPMRWFRRRIQRTIERGLLSACEEVIAFPQRYMAWRVPLAASRLADRVPGEQEWLLDVIQNTQVEFDAWQK